MGQFFFGEDADMPANKTYSESYNEGVDALADSLDKIFRADSQYSPLFNAIFRQDQSDALTQYNKDLQELQLQSLKEYAPRLAEAQLAYEREYGPQFIEMQLKNQRAADPTYWGIRDALGAQVQSDLANGGSLSEAQARQVGQNSRAAMAARGGSSAGYAPAAQEVLGEFLASEGLKTQRQNAASNFLSLGSNTPNSSNSYGGAAPAASVSTSGYSVLSPYMYQNSAAAGGNAANYNNAIYNQQVQWAQNANDQPSMFSTLMGTVMQGVGTGALASQAFKN